MITWITKLFSKSEARSCGDTYNLEKAFGLSPRSASGQAVNSDTATSLTAFFCGVDYLAKMMATVAVDTFERLPNGKRPDHEHPTYSIIKFTPDGELSAWKYRYTQALQTIIKGNSYSEIERTNGGSPLKLHLLNPDDWQAERSAVTKQLWYVNKRQSGTQPIPAYNMLHTSWIASDGITGKSVVQQFRETFGLSLALEGSAQKFFAHSTQAQGFFQAVQGMKPEAIKEFIEQYAKYNSGVENAGKIPVLPSGMTFNGVTLNLTDSQFLESRQFSIVQFAQMLGLPPTKLQDYTHSNFASLEESNSDVVTSTLMPWADNIAGEYNLKLFSPEERKRFFIEHNFNSLLRGNSAARADFYAKLFAVGAFSPNAILRKENENPIDGPEGEYRFVPANYKRLDLAGDPVEAQAAQDKSVSGSRAIESIVKREQEQLPEVVEVRTDFAADQKVIDAVRGVLVDSLKRMIRREGNMVKRAAKNPTEFIAAATEAYREHETFAVDAILPAIKAYVSCSAPGVNEQTAARNLIKSHCNASLCELRELADAIPSDTLASALDDLTERWLSRANEIEIGEDK